LWPLGAVDGLRVIDVERADEIALWLPRQRALVFGDAMIRTQAGDRSRDSVTKPRPTRDADKSRRDRRRRRGCLVLAVSRNLASSGRLGPTRTDRRGRAYHRL